MKNILEYQIKYWGNKSIITEAFSSSILREIRDQLNDRIKANIEKNIEKGYRSEDTSSNFKKVFDKNYYISWDKITDDMFVEYDGKDEKTIKLVKQMISNRTTTFPGMCILINDYDDGPKYIGAIVASTAWPGYISFSSNWTISANEIKPSEVSNILTKKILLIDFRDHKELMNSDKISSRSEAKRNTLNLWNNKELRDFDYNKIAEQNRERYKRYVAKVKAEKDANDGIADKVTEYVNKILDVTNKLSKNPVKYAKLEYEVGYLIDLLNDKRKYVYSSGRGHQGYYSGTDGLLTVFKTYMTTKLSQSKGDSYSHEKQEYEAAKGKLEQIFKTIDEKLKKFEDPE